MKTGAVIVFVCLSVALGVAAQNDATEFRVFLKDGTSLVSFGEFAESTTASSSRCPRRCPTTIPSCN